MRLTDDEIAKLRMRLGLDSNPHRYSAVWGNDLLRLLDEIEERRRIDARRLADAEQAFREECELAAKAHNHLLDDLPWKTHKPTDQLPSAIGVPLPTATWTPKGKDGGERCSEEYFSLGHQMQLRCELPLGHDGLHAKEWGDGNSCKWLGKDGGA